MDKAATQPVQVKEEPKQLSPLSCLPILAAVVLFTMLMAWLIGWWNVSANEHLVQKNMIDIARASVEYHERFGQYPDSFEQLSEYSIMLNPPRNPYSGQPTNILTSGAKPQPGDISLHRVSMNGNEPDLVIVGYGLRPVPEAKRTEWTVLPGGVDADKVLSAISVNALPAEMLEQPVEENSAAEQAADRWKLPEDK
ncbi:MAG: hypothetical protein H7A35_07405 [Planctomycetales bacterium]|nr:hypothetical protein [bacterium]UNM09877.1 MAG: hypothetical protein H7A35_07405 [Planctomycetales bacterium]